MKNKTFWVVTGLLLLVGQQAFSQNKIFENREQTWFGYFNQTRFTNKSGLWVDLHLRLNDKFVNEVGVAIARLGYIYYITDNTRFTVGYAYQKAYAHNNIGPDVPEHRAWQQIQWIEKKSWFTLMQWVRLEERFRRKVAAGELTNHYNFNYRVRYNMSLSIPLKGKSIAPKVPFIFLNDEVHINFGEKIVNNYFDQNRLFMGVGYQLHRILMLTLVTCICFSSYRKAINM